jgi:glycosyltransferase involved in cell wall biosynthesis
MEVMSREPASESANHLVAGMGGIDLSVIVPAYNEAAAIKEVLELLLAALREIPVETELIVVDDYSDDETSKIAGEIEGVRVLRNPRNLGYGHSLLRGMQTARGRYFAISDADGTYPAEELPALWQYIDAGADHVIGARTGKQLTSHFGLRTVYRWLCQLVTGENVPDANSGMRIFDRKLVETLRGDLCRGFSFTTSLTLASLMSGFVVVFHPIPYNERKGRSHVHRIRDTLRTVQYLFQIIAVYNPLKLFLPLVLLSGLLGLAGFAYGGVYGSVWGALTGVLMAATTLILCGIAALSYIIGRMGNKAVNLFERSVDNDELG